MEVIGAGGVLLEDIVSRGDDLLDFLVGDGVTLLIDVLTTESLVFTVPNILLTKSNAFNRIFSLDEKC